jgi:uncharacterized protein
MRTLLVFLKYPAAGQVKSRLADSIGEDRAAELYRQWIGIVFAQVQPVRARARVVACYDGAPPEAFRAWHSLADDWWPQPSGDLGDRLAAAFARWQSAGEPVLAIGTDCLDIDAGHVESAFDLLRSNDAVFGPAADGGYYLVGRARNLPGFFSGVPWSTSKTLSAHRSHCDENHWTYGLLPSLADIDTVEDWRQYERRRAGEP